MVALPGTVKPLTIRTVPSDEMVLGPDHWVIEALADERSIKAMSSSAAKGGLRWLGNRYSGSMRSPIHPVGVRAPLLKHTDTGPLQPLPQRALNELILHYHPGSIILPPKAHFQHRGTSFSCICQCIPRSCTADATRMRVWPGSNALSALAAMGILWRREGDLNSRGKRSHVISNHAQYRAMRSRPRSSHLRSIEKTTIRETREMRSD